MNQKTAAKPMPVISIIMPAYQAQRYISQAVESIQKQTCEEPWELLVIDDCSQDRTAEIIKAYAAADSRIRYVRQNRNRGVAAARNLGLRLARGRYAAFLDADDWWEAGKLKAQMACIRRTGTVLCYTARELVRPDGAALGKIIPAPEQVTYRELLRTNVIPCGSVLLRTDIAREFWFVHDECHEDYILWLHILRKYKTAAGINKPMLKCRLSAGGKSRNKFRSAWMHYGSYRCLGHGRLFSLYHMIFYALNGFFKYL